MDNSLMEYLSKFVTLCRVSGKDRSSTLCRVVSPTVYTPALTTCWGFSNISISLYGGGLRGKGWYLASSILWSSWRIQAPKAHFMQSCSSSVGRTCQRPVLTILPIDFLDVLYTAPSSSPPFPVYYSPVHAYTCNPPHSATKSDELVEQHTTPNFTGRPR
ncbi:hypothetical protein BC826DRAFT_27335 [Russula brevipes]|nr:hypothetical protein BC826DRAFT_27335 [Russula brevipes]